MNKKIWIGLISVLLILILALGIQMLNGEKESTLEQNQEIEPITNTEDEKQPNLEVPEIVEDSVKSTEKPDPEIVEESEQSIEPEIPADPSVETPASTDSIPKETLEPSGQKEPSPLFITLSVSVKTLLDKKDVMNKEKIELVPKDGWIFAPQKVEFYEGESAFNVLLREMKKNKIHMEYVMTPIYNSNYIEGIGNLYEFDCGELSGWMYAVNDSSPSLGTTNYILKDGDVVKLLYTCDLGRDLGFDFNE